jgi:8-amino-7-oxononanoate synthase
VNAALRELSDQGLRRFLAQRATPQSAVIEIEGKQLANFGSNDYLGLASDPRLISAALDAVRQWGMGSGASSLITGRTTLHAELEQRLAAHLACEASLVFPTGFAVGSGVIPALAGDGDTILADAKNHASLIDGCRLSRAARHIYPHGDTAALDALLWDARSARRRLIVTDALFSMDGDFAPLAEILLLAETHDAMFLLDEAHAIGVFGAAGSGVLEHCGLAQSPAARRVLRIGTLSKALGAAGGFVGGPQNVIEWLANRARTYVFSTASPAPVIAAAAAALEIVRGEPQRRVELLQHAESLRSRLQVQGWTTGHSASQIVPVIIGGAEATMALAARLRECGFYVPGIRPPTVPHGESLLRISLCWHHTEEMIDGLVDALARMRNAE